MLSNNKPNFDGNVYYVNVKNMKRGENNSPCIQAATYDAKSNSYPVMEETFTKLEGFIKEISLSDFMYQGNKIEKVNIILEDEDHNGEKSQYRMGLAFSGAAREILNKIATVANEKKLVKKLTIGVYMSTDFKHPETGEAMELRGTWLHYDGEKVAKAYPYDKLKDKVKQVKANNTIINDYSELDSFFKQVVTDVIAPAIPTITDEIFPEDKKEVSPTPEDMKTPNNYKTPDEALAEDDSEADDLPF
jgi:hypothetical protein